MKIDFDFTAYLEQMMLFICLPIWQNKTTALKKKIQEIKSNVQSTNEIIFYNEFCKNIKSTIIKLIRNINFLNLVFNKLRIGKILPNF